METSRITCLGARNYIIRIAAVSQEHVLVCVTRKVTRLENYTVVLASKLIVWVVEIDVLSVWIGVDLISV